jgi:hypothetical protein
MEELGEAEEAMKLRKQAVQQRSSILGIPVDNSFELTECDFNDLVTFWSR